MNEITPSIVEQLMSKLTDIKDKLKGGNIDAFVFENLSRNAKLIQDKVNDLLKKRGLYTQSDINDAYETLQSVERSELEKESKKAMKRLIIYSGIGVALVVGLIIILKKK
jgi:acetate kinase